jgi:hypothetical protein
VTPSASPTVTLPAPAGIPSDSATPIPPVSPGETPPP